MGYFQIAVQYKCCFIRVICVIRVCFECVIADNHAKIFCALLPTAIDQEYFCTLKLKNPAPHLNSNLKNELISSFQAQELHGLLSTDKTMSQKHSVIKVIKKG